MILPTECYIMSNRPTLVKYNDLCATSLEVLVTTFGKELVKLYSNMVYRIITLWQPWHLIIQKSQRSRLVDGNKLTAHPKYLGNSKWRKCNICVVLYMFWCLCLNGPVESVWWELASSCLMVPFVIHCVDGKIMVWCNAYIFWDWYYPPFAMISCLTRFYTTIRISG